MGGVAIICCLKQRNARKLNQKQLHVQQMDNSPAHTNINVDTEKFDDNNEGISLATSSTAGTAQKALPMNTAGQNISRIASVSSNFSDNDVLMVSSMSNAMSEIEMNGTPGYDVDNGDFEVVGDEDHVIQTEGDGLMDIDEFEITDDGFSTIQ